MRVALVCNNFAPEFQGGTERVTLALARALQDLGDDVLVVSGSEQPWRGDDVEREEDLGVPVFRIRRQPEEVYGIEEQTRPRVRAVFEGLLREQRVDVLHLHHWATLSIDLLRAARAGGVGSVATLHDMWATCVRFFRRPPEGIQCPDRDGREACARCVQLDMTTVPLWGLRLGIANRDRDLRGELDAATAVCVPSQACADAIHAHVAWSGSVEVVPHGLLEPVEPRAGVEPRTPLRIGTFGHLVPEKGVEVLVEAMQGVPEAELHLFGSFPDPEFEGRLVARAEAGGVSLACRGAYDAAVAHPAAELDLAVFPSLCQESYGLVVEEALVRGVPVVVSDLGALGERIGEGGVIVPHGDAAALGEVLAGIARDPRRHAELRAGIPPRFSTITDAAGRYRELYGMAMRKS